MMKSLERHHAARRCAAAPAQPHLWKLCRLALCLVYCVATLLSTSDVGAARERAGSGASHSKAPGSLCADGTWPNAIEPARWTDASAILTSGLGTVAFRARNGKHLIAHVYRATTFEPKQSPIWFVMHGVKRDARSYLRAAAPVAERYGALAIAIEFAKRGYPDEEDYTLGVTVRGRANADALHEGRWRKPQDYIYAEVERLFEAVRLVLGGGQDSYYLFGHSAGAQFVHRLLTFLPCARVAGAVAANAGWYTFPAPVKALPFAMPYDLHGSPIESGDLRPLLTAPLTILLGTRDIKTPDADASLRGTPEAMAQGETRVARGTHYFETAKARAEVSGTRFGWRLAFAPGAAHQATQVIASAGYLLFVPGQPPCEPTPAAEADALTINEVLADPVRGRRGDANGDGSRHASEDEFVEIVNAGTTSICLAGWRLSDASGRGGHLFPLGPTLEPGRAVVIFGGGVPTGRFGGAAVQSASDGQLSLSSTGDVLSLRDAAGALAQQISWGDCDGRACSADHRSAALSLGGSIVRAQEPLGAWRSHEGLAAAKFSPGVKADGSAW